MFKVEFDVEGLHPGEPNAHQIVMVNEQALAISVLVELAFVEYPKGDGFIRPLNLSLTSI